MCGLIVALGVAIGQSEIDTLAHRGPDGYGRREFETALGPLVLGHRRLAIIDPDPRADQPMTSDDGQLHIVFNGEIYNFKALRDDLRSYGYQFKTSSDTEVLIQGYRAWGSGLPARLIGMFAFVVLDLDRQTLFLVRDQFGIKPLYVTSTTRHFAVASEMKALLALPFVSRRANPSAVMAFLRNGLVESTPATLFADITAFPPAHWAEVSLASGEMGVPQSYWHPRKGLSQQDASGAPNSLRTLFEECIQLHLVSDVPVGATLSGGLDSSIIVASIAISLPPSAPLNTFSFISEDPDVSEERWIDLMTSHFAITPHKMRSTFENFLGDVDKLILQQDIPLQGPSIFAEYKVYELIRKAGIKVVLGGQGADELFAGYHPYVLYRIVSLLCSGRLVAAWRLARVAERERPGTIRSVLHAIRGSLLPIALLNRFRRPRAWLDDHWRKLERTADFSYRMSLKPGALAERLQYDVLNGSLRAHLRYEDHNSMAHSVESRVPFMVCRMFEFAQGLPESAKIDEVGTMKAVLRQAFAGLVPGPILARTDKIGFAAPDRAWFVRMTATMESWIAGGPDRVGPVSTMHLREMWHSMAEGRTPIDPCLWRVLFFIRWTQLLNVDID